MPVGALPTLLVFNTDAAADVLVALFAALETPDEPVDVETPPDEPSEEPVGVPPAPPAPTVIG